ncbi:MAG: hypothetical protein IJ730_05950 [Alphaproteobacteria bacterium]|nr:hypothetical protein [Alphaproteobacteria bacterium]
MNNNDESLAIFEEINEELKKDKIYEFFRDNMKIITSILGAVLIGIIIYSNWYNHQLRKREDITNALLTVVQNPSSKNILLLEKLQESAPAELRPILMIMKSGKQLMLGNGETNENLKMLLNLCNKRGVDIIWKDLAMLIYTSYASDKSYDELIKMLEPLTQKKRPFRFSAMEMIAMIQSESGRNKEAVEYLEKIVKDKEAPKSMQERLSILLQYMKNEIKQEKVDNI